MKLHESDNRGGIIVKTYKEHLLIQVNRQDLYSAHKLAHILLNACLCVHTHLHMHARAHARIHTHTHTAHRSTENKEQDGRRGWGGGLENMLASSSNMSFKDGSSEWF